MKSPCDEIRLRRVVFSLLRRENKKPATQRATHARRCGLTVFVSRSYQLAVFTKDGQPMQK
jgi:hypothetical protein